MFLAFPFSSINIAYPEPAFKTYLLYDGEELVRRKEHWKKIGIESETQEIKQIIIYNALKVGIMETNIF